MYSYHVCKSWKKHGAKKLELYEGDGDLKGATVEWKQLISGAEWDGLEGKKKLTSNLIWLIDGDKIL